MVRLMRRRDHVVRGMGAVAVLWVGMSRGSAGMCSLTLEVRGTGLDRVCLCYGSALGRMGEGVWLRCKDGLGRKHAKRSPVLIIVFLVVF